MRTRNRTTDGRPGSPRSASQAPPRHPAPSPATALPPTEVTPTEVTPAEGARRTLAIASYGTLVVLAVFAAVVVTVSDSARELHTTVGGTTWILSGMSLGLAIALLTAGALADDFGRRRILIASGVLLTATSVLGALAPSTSVLVTARILQGVAGAGVIAASLGAIGHAFHAGAPRTHATGVWAAAVGGGIALGPVIGAALTTALGWRSSFWLEAIASALLVAAALSLPESRAAIARGIDLPGAATLAVAMGLLTAGLVEGRSGWASPTTIALLAGGLATLAGFALIELRRRVPMLDLHLFRDRRFIASITGALFTGLAVIGLMSFSSTVMQHGLHVSVVGSAAVLAVWSGTSMAVALGARRLPMRLSSPTRLAIGLGLCAIGEVGLTGLDASAGWTRLVPGLLVAGVGSGIANAALGRLAVESVPRERAGVGSGANNTARYLGGAAGVALVVAISSGAGATDLVYGWSIAAAVSAALCALGAAIALACRPGS
jgi:MFS family permease